jgi:hypothetical protein
LGGVFSLRLRRVTTEGTTPPAPIPWDWGLGGVFFILGDSTRLDLEEALATLRLGVILVGGVFLVAKGFRVFAGLGELLVPLGLAGSDA